MAAAQSLHYGHGVPVRRLPAILGELTGIHLTQGRVPQDALRQAAGPVGAVYQTRRTEMARVARVQVCGASAAAFASVTSTLVQRDSSPIVELAAVLRNRAPSLK